MPNRRDRSAQLTLIETDEDSPALDPDASWARDLLDTLQVRRTRSPLEAEVAASTVASAWQMDAAGRPAPRPIRRYRAHTRRPRDPPKTRRPRPWNRLAWYSNPRRRNLRPGSPEPLTIRATSTAGHRHRRPNPSTDDALSDRQLPQIAVIRSVRAISRS
jgi:hypothetical protein